MIKQYLRAIFTNIETMYITVSIQTFLQKCSYYLDIYVFQKVINGAVVGVCRFLPGSLCQCGTSRRLNKLHANRWKMSDFISRHIARGKTFSIVFSF